MATLVETLYQDTKDLFSLVFLNPSSKSRTTKLLWSSADISIGGSRGGGIHLQWLRRTRWSQPSESLLLKAADLFSSDQNQRIRSGGLRRSHLAAVWAHWRLKPGELLQILTLAECLAERSMAPLSLWAFVCVCWHVCGCLDSIRLWLTETLRSRSQEKWGQTEQYWIIIKRMQCL